MAAQIGKILELSAAGKVRMQLIPFDAGAYSVADINFTLLEFSEPVLPPAVFVEGLVGSPYYERPMDVARYRESIENIRDSALSPTRFGTAPAGDPKDLRRRAIRVGVARMPSSRKDVDVN